MSSARNQGWVPQTAGDTQHNVRDAALRGAAKAFSKSPAKPKPLVNTYTGGDNGALLAATKVGTGSPASLRSHHTGGSVGVSKPNLSKSNSSNSLSVPDDHPGRVSWNSPVKGRYRRTRRCAFRAENLKPDHSRRVLNISRIVRPPVLSRAIAEESMYRVYQGLRIFDGSSE